MARHVQVIDIPDAYNVLASYPIAMLKGAQNAEAARAFIALVLSSEGQRPAATRIPAAVGGSPPRPQPRGPRHVVTSALQAGAGRSCCAPVGGVLCGTLLVMLLGLPLVSLVIRIPPASSSNVCTIR